MSNEPVQHDPEADRQRGAQNVADDLDRARHEQLKAAHEAAARVASGTAVMTVAAGLLPERRNGRLTRRGMEKVIAGGGSVLHNGQVHLSLQSLPTEADLANGDQQATLDALKSLDDQQARLDAERMKIHRSAAGPTPQAGIAEPPPADPVRLPPIAIPAAPSQQAGAVSRDVAADRDLTAPQLHERGLRAAGQTTLPFVETPATPIARPADQTRQDRPQGISQSPEQGGGLTVRTPEESHARAARRAEEAAGNEGSAVTDGSDDEDDQLLFGRPLSFYDGKSDQQLDEIPGIGEAKIAEIRAAQKARDDRRAGRGREQK